MTEISDEDMAKIFKIGDQVSKINKAKIEAETKRLTDPVSTNEQLNRQYGVARIEGDTVVINKTIDKATGDPKINFIKLSAFKPLYDHKHAVDESGHPIQNQKAGTHWLTWSGRNTYHDVYFKPIPGKVFNPTDTMPKGDQFNLYLGMKYAPKEGKCDLIKKHILNIWCKGDCLLYDYVTGWFARMVQHPDKPAYSALVLLSEEGAGKNIIIDPLVEAFGSHGVICSSPDEVTGRFNSAMATAVIVFLNEAVWGGDKTGEGRLKQLVTDDMLSMERKYIDKKKVKNCTHVIVSSNNEFPISIDRSDRRYVVIELDNSQCNNNDYFLPLAEEISTGGKEAFLYHLTNYSLNKFNPRKLPNVNHSLKDNIKLKSADSKVRWFDDVLEDGFITLIEGSMKNEVINGDSWEMRGVRVNRADVYDHYAAFCNKSRLHVEGKKSLGWFFQHIGVDNTKKKTYIFPSLSECEKNFNKYMHK